MNEWAELYEAFIQLASAFQWICWCLSLNRCCFVVLTCFVHFSTFSKQLDHRELGSPQANGTLISESIFGFGWLAFVDFFMPAQRFRLELIKNSGTYSSELSWGKFRRGNAPTVARYFQNFPANDSEIVKPNSTRFGATGRVLIVKMKPKK